MNTSFFLVRHKDRKEQWISNFLTSLFFKRICYYISAFNPFIMNFRSVTGLLFILFPVLLSAQVRPYQIKAIKAHLFYNGESRQDSSVRGTLSEDLVDNGAFALWNTIIGEGSAKAESNQTLVVVEITGNPKEFLSRNVVLTVRTNGKQIFRQAQAFSILDDRRNYSAAFLLYDTGCQPLTLKAEIVNEKILAKKKVSTVESSLTKTVPFACGE
jgi:hypothetical protein